MLHKQPNNSKGKRLAKLAARAKTRKTKKNKEAIKRRRVLARQKYVRFFWGVRNNDNPGPPELNEEKEYEETEVIKRPIEPVTNALVIVPKSRQKV